MEKGFKIKTQLTKLIHGTKRYTQYDSTYNIITSDSKDTHVFF